MSKISEIHIKNYNEVIELWKTCSIKIEPEDDFVFFEKLIEYPHTKCLICIADNKIIGSVIAATDGRYGYLHHLAVLPEYRGKGIGKMLVESAQDFFKKEYNIKLAIVMVWNSNVEGVAFWESCGYKTYENLNTMARDL